MEERRWPTSATTGIASLCVVVGCTLLIATQMSRATTSQTDTDQARAGVGSSFVEPHPASVVQTPPAAEALRDANGNLFRHSGRPVEIRASPVIIYPASIDVMQVFMPWEFRVTGMFER
jgi:hypothetical protein